MTGTSLMVDFSKTHFKVCIVEKFIAQFLLSRI